METPHGEPPRRGSSSSSQPQRHGGEPTDGDGEWVEMERFNPTARGDQQEDDSDNDPNNNNNNDGDGEELAAGSKSWGPRLFRTAENERAPSRTRRKPSLVSSADRSSSIELQREESSQSLDAGESGLRQRKRDSGSKSKAAWHASQNPLFKSKAAEGEQEAVPFHVWGYETVLNFLWPPFNYFRIHFLYIWFLSIVGGILVYASQLGLSSEMTFLDSLFHAVSACTQTGLFPSNFSQFSRLGQVIIGALIFLGNGVLLTIAPVCIRIYYYRRFFKQNNVVATKSDEYRALWQLVVIIPIYYCVLVGGGWIVMSAHMSGDPSARDIIDKNDNNPAWWGLFHAISGFGNCGYSTFGDNMVQWQRYPLPLIVMSLLIFTGNTAFPILLRGIIVALYHMPFLKRWKHVYRYMLDNPRRCFTHLFPSSETKWLLLVLLSLNTIEFLFEIVLDWDSSAYDNLNSGQKLVNMYFQSVAIRTSGFNSVDITKLSAANLWLFTGMMYIAASPVAITLRYTRRTSDSLVTSKTSKTTNTVGSQAQQIFMRHFILLFIGLLFICMIEEVPLATDPGWSIFKIIFEVVSGYGTVGLTLGYGTLPYSFCGVWKDGSKMVLLFIMILGKHRNLPESIDSAVSVPSHMAFEDEDELSNMEVVSDDDDDDEDVISQEELDNPGSSEDDRKHKQVKSRSRSKSKSRSKSNPTTTDDDNAGSIVGTTDTEGV